MKKREDELNNQNNNQLLPEIKKRVSIINFKEQEISSEQLKLLIEAARWAPSSYNNQPWNYVFVSKKDSTRSQLEKSLALGNGWAKAAPYLIAVVGKPEDDTINQEIEYYLYDIGLSMMSLSLQAIKMGLGTHHMAGFDQLKAKSALGIPNKYKIIVLVALGYEEKTPPKIVSKIKDKIFQPRTRKPVKEHFFFERWGY